MANKGEARHRKIPRRNGRGNSRPNWRLFLRLNFDKEKAKASGNGEEEIVIKIWANNGGMAKVRAFNKLRKFLEERGLGDHNRTIVSA